ncbi:MAG: hypothetical protein A2V67_11470 [Deltaproteobacteria bacterium RBG_13_61_14]|nr:MAG: hypothetical protein A2V67_11470 [Deltaproteobacteria bacterium RBG_13_61_14]
MNKSYWITALTFSGALLLAASGGRAATVVPLSLHDLVATSDLVIESRVITGTADFCGPAGASMLFTYWEVEVKEALKGTAAASVLVRTPGGGKDGRELVVPGAPGFQPDQRLILFLKKTEESRSGRPVYEVLGWQQGALEITAEPASGEPVVRRPAQPSEKKPARPVAVKLKEFKREVRALAQPPAAAEPSPEASP